MWDSPLHCIFSLPWELHEAVWFSHVIVLYIDGLRETINQLTPGVNRPKVKGYAYCHTFVGMNWSCNVTFRPLTRWFKAAVPSDVRIGVERAK